MESAVAARRDVPGPLPDPPAAARIRGDPDDAWGRRRRAVIAVAVPICASCSFRLSTGYQINLVVLSLGGDKCADVARACFPRMLSTVVTATMVVVELLAS